MISQGVESSSPFFFFYLWCFSIPLELLDGVVMWQCSKLDSQTFPWWSWADRLQYCQKSHTEVSHDCSSLCKSTIKNMGFYDASALRMKVHHGFKKVSSLFYRFFIISGEFSVFSQRLLLVAFDVRWVFSLVGSHLNLNMPMEPFPSALSPSTSGKLSGFLPGYTKTTRIGSFRHLERTCLQLML